MNNLKGSKAVSNRDDYLLLFLCLIKCVEMCRYKNKKKRVTQPHGQATPAINKLKQ